MIDLYDFVAALNAASLPTDIINPSASGTAANIILQTWKVKHGQRFITNFVLGEMGAGIPYSIGAALATGKRILHIEGDGGIQIALPELEIIRHLNLPIIIFCINNNGYASIRESQMRAFGRVTGADNTSGVTLPELWQVAETYKLGYRAIYDNDPIKLDMCPALIEVAVRPDQQYRHRVLSKLVDGKMTTAPMDMVD